METNWDLLALPRVCGLLARKPTTLSQSMHNAGFRALDLPFRYTVFDTEDTAHSLATMRRLGYRGFSLTIPHKEIAVGLVDRLSGEASKIGAVNTVVNDGRLLTGFNTDWIGVREALLESGIDVTGQSVLVFGAGGAARAALYALEKMGAGSITICNRTPERASQLAKEVGANALRVEELTRSPATPFGLLINTTPIGSHLEQTTSPLESFYAGPSKSSPAYFEMVTKETPLSSKARATGAAVVPGSRMLLHQALEQFRLFTEREPQKEVMEAALKAELENS